MFDFGASGHKDVDRWVSLRRRFGITLPIAGAPGEAGFDAA